MSVLDEIQLRVLWLATNIIHHANHVRPSSDGSKVGGHQASSASTVSILTALYFHFLEPGDRVSIKPHASPVFHAIQFLLGQLPREYLTTLRQYHGLQAYPSRTKDPDPVDFSTGSVGLGAVAPAFAAVAHRYAQARFGEVSSRRFVALVGDAELDEGNVWEALLEESLAGLGNLLWIVDLNRQSLDRVVPGIRAARLKKLFAETGWQVLEAKYGRRLQALFAKRGGKALRQRIDDMSNEEYQALIRLPGAELRERLAHADHPGVASVIAAISDDELPGVLANLGGHDLEELLTLFDQIKHGRQQPTVLFAYTIKGWGLPFAGHPLNHSMLLSEEQVEALRESMGIAPDCAWDGFASESPAGRRCAEVAAKLYAPQPAPVIPEVSHLPDHVGLPAARAASTQETLGRLLVRLADLDLDEARLDA